MECKELRLSYENPDLLRFAEDTSLYWLWLYVM